MEKKQTPLQKIIEFMDKMPHRDNVPFIYTKVKSLLSEERQMVIDVYNEAKYNAENGITSELFKTGEQYFTDTYGKDK